MKQPTAQELIDVCDMGIWAWVEWYNFRLKLLQQGRSHEYANIK